MEAVSKMEEQEIDQLSRQLKLETHPKSLIGSVLNQENLERLGKVS